ncbi:hypothetical protein M406DRAFT_72687 [Cryphonectria parasitica EP155]|uniref:Uncharacterized protein n=1 Tax=Cryphonectria parasitica (strain ATCC 38755 / EP155) TaxID=660469 RepID=A0A9P5CLY6_CRYP1|nr:uncharacterized protein M406DRAFT_72687 [Cryphonectria parasitica EP155]KAF3762707.1 hypothetical protein M406DRAFT_72687 [Cryphonectria parasitica EP155]
MTDRPVDKARITEDDTTYYTSWVHIDRFSSTLFLVQDHSGASIQNTEPTPMERWLSETPSEACWDGVESFRVPTIEHPAQRKDAAPVSDTDVTIADTNEYHKDACRETAMLLVEITIGRLPKNFPSS